MLGDSSEGGNKLSEAEDDGSRSWPEDERVEDLERYYNHYTDEENDDGSSTFMANQSYTRSDYTIKEEEARRYYSDS
ncbi:hypothetical protein BC829DRAFT_390381 [Chytridium lagenaria]|nr:hypothetical protein BC829DRAFT_390381 [Chytridium lagenaria]